MALQQISGSGQNPSWNGSDLKEGDEIHGYYIAHKTDVGKFRQHIYVIREKNSDKDMDVWGSTVLNRAFEQIKLGAEVKIVYTGKLDTGKGQPANTYDVYADNDQATE